MFTTNHFIWLALCACFIVILLTVSVKCKFSFKTSAYIMAGISLVSELFKIFTNIKETENGGILEPKYLPLHLCSILIFLFFFLALSKDEEKIEKVKSFVTPISIFGGLLAMLIPTNGVDFLKPQAYQCFVYHAGMIWFALYLIVTKQVNLGFKAYLRNMATLASMLVCMIWVNGALSEYNTNFFYVVRPPMKNLPVLNLDNGWFAYFLTLVGIGLFCLTLAHLKGIIKDLKNKNKQ